MKIPSKYCIALLFPLLISNTGLSAEMPELVVEKKAGQSSEGKIIWADLYTGNVESSLTFYTNTFGWSVKKFGQDNSRYHLLYDGAKPIAGVLARSAQRNKTENSLWIGSIATSNVQAGVDRATENKATIILAPHDFALYGERAVIADPQGGVIALLNLDEQQKSHQKISHKWDWAQLFSVNTQQAAKFYQNTFNYSIEAVDNNKSSFYLLQQEAIRASIVHLPTSFEQRDRWVNFVEVTSLKVTLAAAIKNGANIIYQPEGDQLAIISDPNGALLGLTEQESE